MTSTASSPLSAVKERRGDEWGVVIKVKCGDTVKRFSAFIHQPTMIFEYDINKLKSKISNLFMIDPDAVLVLTYTDEDGDIVALDNDEELHDAVIYQSLNPLRIHLQLKPTSVSNSTPMPMPMRTDDESSATASSASGFPQLVAELNAAARESLKSVPEPIRGFLTNACHDVLQAASSAPTIAKLLKPMSNLQLSNATRSSNDSSDNHFPTTLPRTNHVSPAPMVTQNMHEVGNVRLKPKTEPVDATDPTTTEQKNGDVYNGGTPLSFDTLKCNIVPTFVHGSRRTEANAFPGRHPQPHPYKSSFRHGRLSRIFHRGVICDGCGMHPIVGPRYKSTMKDDYDLCSACFHDVGIEAEYTRIDWSGFWFPKAMKHHRKLHRSRLRRTLAPCNGLKSPLPKLDSCFIRDVTVWDGTVMPLSSHFTKIWRMRNNGTAAWPFGAQLVWAGGEQFGAQASSELEIPATGLPVNAELDIAVDFVAPSVLGYYRSYWQMALPSGEKFGEYVWVIIQVDDHQSASASQSFLNLNTLPESTRPNNPFIIDVDSEPMDFIPSEPDPPASTLLEIATTLEGTSAPQPSDNHPNSSPKHSQLHPIDVPPSSSQVPLVDVSSSDSLENITHPTDAFVGENPVEETLLRELAEMGFKQGELNQEVLRRNQYDLEQSLEDLCELDEWDPLLNELQEMGFGDRVLNTKLLSKNGGSIKRVVLDLIAVEKVE